MKINTISLTTIMLLLTFCLNARTLVVTNTNDFGLGSLRTRIASANDGDVIRFSPNIIRDGDAIIHLSSTIVCKKSISIIGLIKDFKVVKITAPNTATILEFDLYSNVLKEIMIDSLYVVNGGNGIKFTGNKLVIKNSVIKNHTNRGVDVDMLLNASFPSDYNFVFENCIISNNGLTSNYGGGINIYIGTVNYTLNNAKINVLVKNSKIQNNKSNYFAGGITANCGSRYINFLLNILVENSSISDNYGNKAGGIFSEAIGASTSKSINNSLIKAVNSNISNNTANNGVGGMYSSTIKFGSRIPSGKVLLENSIMENNTGIYGAINAEDVQLFNSTLSYNYGSVVGGIFSKTNNLYNSTYVVRIVNSTLIGNENTTSAANSAGTISTHSINLGTSNIFIESSIVISNAFRQFYVNTITEKVNSQGFNAFNDSTLVGSLSSDVLGVTYSSLKLKTLNYCGGFTKSYMPDTGSVVINAGKPSDYRSAQNRLIQDGRRDIGAVENNCQYYKTDTVYSCNGTIWRGFKYDNEGSYLDFYNGYPRCDTIFQLILLSNNINSSVSLIYPFYKASLDSASYQWLYCNNKNELIKGATNQWFTIPGNGSYAVEIVKNGCRTVSDCYLINNAGINESKPKDVISIFPNPNNGNFAINLEEKKQEIIVVISDVNGKLVKQIIEKNKSKIEVGFEGDNGIYFVKVFIDGEFSSFKIVKNK